MTNYEKLRGLLAELFQFDQADLDFGIYRIMNQKRDEITRFLDRDLLPQVKQTLEEYQSGVSDAGQAELAEAIKQAQALGADPDTLPKVQELKAKLGPVLDTAVLEEEVFSHLYDFFRRYYSDGDFISLRRYKEGVYAIPYEGEEVKLYWANHDQYYVKSSENFRDYTFKLPDDRRVHFRVVRADATSDNNKAEKGNKRRFLLHEEDPAVRQDGDLVIQFVYSADTRRQDTINAATAATLSALPQVRDWLAGLQSPFPTKRNPHGTLLEWRLEHHAKYNEFDYFIHKDLSRFLRRELDFYIKNEIMHLDDIEGETPARVEQYLGKVRALRKVAGKLITFLAQLEDFQKRLWLKKKFVVETNYCVTLDRVPEELYPEILANEAQMEEWRRLFAIDEIGGGPLPDGRFDEEFLKANPFLVLDTAHFPQGIKDRLLQAADELDTQANGLLVHSENFGSLSLLERRFRGQIKCIYIDPPYNTGSDEFLYKDGYLSSSWLCMMQSRARLAECLLSNDGLFSFQIGDDEVARLRLLIEDMGFHRKNTAVVRRGIKNVQAQFGDIDKLALGHDVVHIVAKRPNLRIPHLRRPLVEEKAGKWDTFWRGTDRPTMRYELFGQHPDTGQWRWEPGRAKGAVANYEYYQQNVADEKTLDEWYVENLEAGQDLDFVRLNEENVVQYYVPPQGSALLSDNWLDIPAAGTHTEFPHEKSIDLLSRVISWNTGDREYVLDYFAGSGTTAHATIALSREDGLRRRYVLIEMGKYFDTILLPRIKRTIYSRDWRGNRPVSRDGSSHLLKYVRLESYEDTLNNLQLSRTPEQQLALEAAGPEAREEYLLSYMFDLEATGSQSLLNLDAFRNPFEYKLKVSTGIVGEPKTVNVDLVETFNYLIGLWVKHIDMIRGVRVVEGISPAGERVLVLWRNVDQTDNDALDDWFRRQGYNTRDLEYDIIYVNGDNNLENLRRVDQTWKVRLIEADFHRLMFDVQDV